MKKVISAVLACVFVFTLAFSAFAAASPNAPTINTTRPTTDPSDIDPTIQPPTKPGADSTTKPGADSTTKPGDVDEPSDPSSDETTTKHDLTSDKKPVSPDTGSHVGNAASAAVLVAIALGGAVVYTTKKKAE